MTQLDAIRTGTIGTTWSGRVALHAPWIMIAYIALQFGLRLTAPGGLGLDEAEQMVAVQRLELGYGAQPPLYTWLQIAMFEITGPGKLGLALLKHLLLASIYLGIWTLARLMGANHLTAAAAMFGTMLLPSVVWEAQRALTHSVLATALSVWTLVAATQAARTGRLRDFCLTGLAIGLGLLAKWSYALVLFGLVAMAFALPSLRSRKTLLTIAIAAAIVAVPVWWVFDNWALTTASVHKLNIQSAPGQATAGAALLSLAEAVAANAAVVVLVFLLVFRTGAAAGDAPHKAVQLVEPVLFFGVLGVALILLVSGAASIRERWLQPIMVFVPIALALRLAPWITAERMRWLLAVTAVVALSVSVAFSLRLRHGGDDPGYHAAPFEAAATDLGLSQGFALVSDTYLAGNLRLIRPDLAVLVPDLPKLRLEGAPDQLLWRTRRGGDAPMPGDLRALAAARGVSLDGNTAPERVSIPYPPPHADRTFGLYRLEVRP